MLALQGRPHLNLNRANAWVTADSSGRIAKPLRKILDYGGMFSPRMIHLSVGFLEKKKNVAGFHIYNLLQCCGTFWEDPFWDMGICGNGLLSTSVRSGGRKKKVWVPPARQRPIAEPCRHPRKGSKLQTTHTTSWKPARMLRWLLSLFCRTNLQRISPKNTTREMILFFFFAEHCSLLTIVFLCVPGAVLAALNNVPSNLPSDIVKMDLSRNNIQHLRPKQFLLSKDLKLLNLSSNSLRHIDTGEANAQNHWSPWQQSDVLLSTPPTKKKHKSISNRKKKIPSTATHKLKSQVYLFWLTNKTPKFREILAVKINFTTKKTFFHIQTLTCGRAVMQLHTERNNVGF